MDNEVREEVTEQEVKKTDGRDTGKIFVSKIGMVGCVMFLIMLVGFLLVCFSAGSQNPIEGYEPPRESAYYKEYPGELVEEINENIAPQLESITECYYEDGKVVIITEEAEYFTVRSALLDYFDEELFDFRKDTDE
ncbi:MAG: hypothetical protein IJP22_03980 [Clostridia bacterium]|nr:hypothetical protein [Clostridia bacterium]